MGGLGAKEQDVSLERGRLDPDELLELKSAAGSAF